MSTGPGVALERAVLLALTTVGQIDFLDATPRRRCHDLRGWAWPG
jgi:hypothetical protein